jgi:TonB family protein
MLAAMFLLGSELAYTTQGCGTIRFQKQLAYSEDLITHAVMFEPPVPEMPTRNGSYECVRFSFRVDPSGHATEVHVEESSNDGALLVDARRALDLFRFRKPPPGSQQRLTLVFDGMVGRWPELPPDIR